MMIVKSDEARTAVEQARDAEEVEACKLYNRVLEVMKEWCHFCNYSGPCRECIMRDLCETSEKDPWEWERIMRGEED